MPKPYKFPFLDSCKKRFSQTHNEVDLALRPVVGLVLQVEDAEKCPQSLGFKGLDQFLRVSKQVPCFTAIEDDGSDDRPVQLELDCGADGVALPDPV